MIIGPWVSVCSGCVLARPSERVAVAVIPSADLDHHLTHFVEAVSVPGAEVDGKVPSRNPRAVCVGFGTRDPRMDDLRYEPTAVHACEQSFDHEAQRCLLALDDRRRFVALINTGAVTWVKTF